jgi:superfamily II DNA/RNA helicase
LCSSLQPCFSAAPLPDTLLLACRQRNIAATYVLVLTPTRELAAQVCSMMQNLAQFTDIQVCGGQHMAHGSWHMGWLA